MPHTVKYSDKNGVKTEFSSCIMLYNQNTIVIIRVSMKRKRPGTDAWHDRVSRCSGSVVPVVLACGGSALLSAAFPPANMQMLAWVGFVPLFASVVWWSRVQRIVSAVLGGVVYYVLLYAWMQRFHRGVVLVIAAVFGVVFFALPLLLCGWFARNSRTAAFIAVPALWVIGEFAKTLGPLSFAFGIVGYSQFAMPRLIQIADVTGVYGVSFVLVLGNYALFVLCEIVSARLRAERRSIDRARSTVLPLIASLLLVITVLGYGTVRLRMKIVPRDLRVQLAQLHHGSRAAWRADQEEHLKEYETLVAVARDFSPDLVIFPEGAVNRFVSVDPAVHVEGSATILNRISRIAREGDVALLLGVLETASISDPARFNSAFLFERTGGLAGVYRKVYLVPFGETDPFSGRLPRLEAMLRGETDIVRLDRGRGPRVMEFTSGRGEVYRFGTLICFESTRGDYARLYGAPHGENVDFLVNITSDAWTRSSGALEQHAAFSVFRAVESRRMVFRVGNGGLTGVINPHGFLVRRLPFFTRGVLLSELMVPADPRPGVYARWGDWLIWVCLALVAGTTAVSAIYATYRKTVGRVRGTRYPEEGR